MFTFRICFLLYFSKLLAGSGRRVYLSSLHFEVVVTMISSLLLLIFSKTLSVSHDVDSGTTH